MLPGPNRGPNPAVPSIVDLRAASRATVDVQSHVTIVARSHVTIVARSHVTIVVARSRVTIVVDPSHVTVIAVQSHMIAAGRNPKTGKELSESHVVANIYFKAFYYYTIFPF